MRLVDANVLLYAVNQASPQHESSRTWLDTALNATEPVGFAWVALVSFLRIASHPAVFARPLEPADAIDVVRGWLAQPAALAVSPTSRHLDILAGLIAETGTAANLVNDAHLAALAVEHDAVIASFDADFGRFRGVRWERPAAPTGD